MSETVSDLELDDEHVTIGLEDTLVEGCKRLVSIPSGILVVLDDEDQVKGVIGQRQMHEEAIGNGVDVNETTCKEVMEMDVLKVSLSDSIADVIKSVNERMPQAVVAVNESGAFEGYFSPDDYRQKPIDLISKSSTKFALNSDALPRFVEVRTNRTDCEPMHSLTIFSGV